MFDAALIDGVVGEAVEDFFEHDSGFEARDLRSDTDVGCVAEAEIPRGRTLDIESVGILELPLVSVGRGVEKQDPLAGDQVLAM